VPSRGALMVCSIFIASITASAWPRLTASPAGQEGHHLAGHRRGQAAGFAGMFAAVRQRVHQRDQRSEPSGAKTLKRFAARVDRQGMALSVAQLHVVAVGAQRARLQRPALAADLQRGGAVVQALHHHHQRLALQVQVEAAASAAVQPPAVAAAPGVGTFLRGFVGQQPGHHAGGGQLGRQRRLVEQRRAFALDQRGVQVGGGKGRLPTTRRRKATLLCRPTMCVSRSAASSRASACARSRPRRSAWRSSSRRTG
jgi:hypothetical protein